MTDQTVYRFNTANQIESMTDRNSNTWTFEYNVDGIIAKITDPAGLETVLASSNGRVDTITDPANRVTTLQYDADGNLVRITDPDETSRQWGYDASHRMISHTDKRDFTEHVIYDFAGRAERSIRKDGTEQFYDPVQTQVLFPFDQTTDPLNSPAVSTITQIIGRYADPNGNVTETVLDKQGQAVSSRDSAGALPAVGRNGENLVVRQLDGRGNLTSYEYDPQGNVVAIRDTISSAGSARVDNQGRDFWISFQQNQSAAELSLFLTGSLATQGVVEIPGTNFTENFSITPGEITTVSLPATTVVSASNSVSNRGVHVTAGAPISLYGLNRQEFTTDGFMALPTSVLGTEYLVMAYPGFNGSQLSIVGTEDNSEVTVILPVATAGRPAATPFTVTVNMGEVYFLQSTGGADLTGASISAGKPVAVFGGHRCANVPPSVAACDHLVEQMPPANTWGTEFVTVPLATRINGDTFRFLASTDDTEVFVDGESVATLNRGDFHERIITAASRISSTQPILVAQFSNGSDFDGVVSDPFMVLVPPFEQFISSYTVATPADGFSQNFINVVTRTTAIGTLRLDGTAIPATEFFPVGESGFSAAQLSVTLGTHNLSGAFPFGIFLYGFDEFDSYGFLGGQAFAPVQVRTFSYDPVFSQLTSVTDELSHTILYDLDPNTGNVVRQPRVIGELDSAANGETDDLVTTMTYTQFGLIDTMTDELGRVTDYNYDARGLMTSVTYALGTPDEATMTYEYDLAGNRTLITDGEGNRTEYKYDARNRLVRTIEQDPDGTGPLTSPATIITYDPTGNVVSTTDPNANTTTNHYDRLDRLIEVASPDPDGAGPLPTPITTFTYDPAGNMETMTDPNDHVTSYRYDGRNRRISMTDPDGGVTQFGYDSDNNLSRVTDPVANVTRFLYDVRDRLVEETDPFGEKITYEYDAANNLIRKTDRNDRVTQYTYDDVNRLLTEEWLAADGSVVNAITYTYDKASNLLSLDDNQSALSFTYDARDRVQTVDNLGTPGVPNVVLTYTYDDVSNVLSVTDTIDGNPGATTGYQYDGLNRLISLNQSGTDTSDKRVDFTYNALGQYTAIDRYSDLAGTQLVIGTIYSYDGQNRLTRLDHQNAQDNSVAFYAYVYDTESRITQITNIDGVTTYGYDDRDQLTSANYTDPTRSNETYQYDANGNRVQSSLHGTGYVTDLANRLISDGTYNYDYDDEGNMIRRTRITGTEADGSSIREFTWDHRNRLTAVIDKRSDDTLTQEVRFDYDATDRRIKKSVDTTPNDGIDAVFTHFVYERSDVILDFVDGDGSGPNTAALANRVLHGPAVDQALSVEDSTNTLHWLMADVLGSIRDVIDETSTITNHISYDAFGNILEQSNTMFGSRYLFAGREFDAETGLYYLRTRFLDPSVGSFLSEDSIGLRGGDANLRRFVFNRPTSLRDHDGKAAETVWDIANILLGLGSLGNNIYNGNFVDALIDAGGIIVDGAATVVPFVPGGAAAAIKVCRVGKLVDKLHDGARLATNDALDAAADFLGPGYRHLGNGRYVSKDGLRQVRMGDSDILGKHGGGPHINFETLAPNPRKPGKNMVIENKHIFLED